MKNFLLCLTFFLLGVTAGILPLNYHYQQNIHSVLDSLKERQDRLHENVLTKVNILQDKYFRLKERYQNLKGFECTVTAYTARKAETDSTPHKTALMQRPIPGWTVAVSQDLKHLLGRKIYIEGVGIRKVNDLMNARFKKRVDICVPNINYAFQFGKKKGRKIVVLGS